MDNENTFVPFTKGKNVVPGTTCRSPVSYYLMTLYKRCPFSAKMHVMGGFKKETVPNVPLFLGTTFHTAVNSYIIHGMLTSFEEEMSVSKEISAKRWPEIYKSSKTKVNESLAKAIDFLISLELHTFDTVASEVPFVVSWRKYFLSGRTDFIGMKAGQFYIYDWKMSATEAYLDKLQMLVYYIAVESVFGKAPETYFCLPLLGRKVKKEMTDIDFLSLDMDLEKLTKAFAEGTIGVVADLSACYRCPYQIMCSERTLAAGLRLVPGVVNLK